MKYRGVLCLHRRRGLRFVPWERWMVVQANVFFCLPLVSAAGAIADEKRGLQGS